MLFGVPLRTPQRLLRAAAAGIGGSSTAASSPPATCVPESENGRLVDTVLLAEFDIDQGAATAMRDQMIAPSSARLRDFAASPLRSSGFLRGEVRRAPPLDQVPCSGCATLPIRECVMTNRRLQSQ